MEKYTINTIPIEIKELIVTQVYWADPDSLIELSRTSEIYRQIAIKFLEKLDGKGICHQHDNWSLWIIKNKAKLPYFDGLVDW